MPVDKSVSQNATPVWITGPDGNPVYPAASGQQPAASSQSVTPASDTAPFPVRGVDASGSAATVQPVGIGGRVTTTGLTFQDGQRADLQMDANGGAAMYLKVPGVNIGLATPVAPADNESANRYGLTVYGRGQVWNGTGWDKQRGDTSGSFIGANQFFTESTTALAASATFNGTLRTNGGTAGGVGSRFSFFIAEAFSDVAGGTLYIDKTVDGGTTYRQVGSVALVAGSSVSLKVPISTAGHRVRVVNGTNAQTASLVTSAYSLN